MPLNYFIRVCGMAPKALKYLLFLPLNHSIDINVAGWRKSKIPLAGALICNLDESSMTRPVGSHRLCAVFSNDNFGIMFHVRLSYPLRRDGSDNNEKFAALLPSELHVASLTIRTFVLISESSFCGSASKFDCLKPQSV